MKNVTFGYARISSDSQNLSRQIQQLTAAGVLEKHIVVDKESGKDFNRKGYRNLIQDRLDEGDNLVICSLDRLGRNYSEIMEQWRHITTELKVGIKVLDMPLLDTTDNSQSLDGRFIADLVLQILSYVSEKERLNIRLRQRQGIDAMPVVDGKRVSPKTKRPTGRPRAEYPENWTPVFDDWKSSKTTARNAMRQLGLKPNTFYKLAREYSADKAY